MKQTVEEAARTHWSESTYNKDAELAYDERDCIAIKALAKAIVLRAFKKGADWQARQSPWISVEEQLPKEGQKVFVLVMCYGTPCIREEKFCRNSNLDKKGMWIHGNSIVLAWFPSPLSRGYSKPTRMYWNGLRRKETELWINKPTIFAVKNASIISMW